MNKRTRTAPHAKLTADQVLEIRRLAGTSPQWVIAKAFGVTDALVSQIINGRAWRWLKDAARMSALLIVGVAAAAAADQSELYKMLNSCDVSVGTFLNANTQPRTDCDYQLTNVVVLQKLKDGFLLSGDFEMGGTEPGVIFLKTKAPLPQGTRFAGEKVHPAGTYKYTGIDGFEKQVWAFDVVIPDGAKAIGDVQ